MITMEKTARSICPPNLFEWQKEHTDAIETALRSFGYAKDGSDTGTGKTIIALTVASRLHLSPFVICPKAVAPSWREWMEAFGFEPRVYSYEKMRLGKTMHYIKRSKASGQWTIDNKKNLLIFDEDHRCKSHKSENAKMMIAAKSRGVPTLCLGATSCTNPTEMRALGYVLDMHSSNNWWNWCLKNGCKKGTFGGLVFQGYKSVLKRIHEHIYGQGRGSRISIRDLPPGTFPETMIVPQGYDLGTNDDVNAIYQEMATELAELEDAKNPDEDLPLTIQLRARQEVELLKVPVFEELTRDAYAEGNSVVIFVNFRATLEALLKRLSGVSGISMVYGAQDEGTRHAEVRKFQSDDSRICLCMTQAGGTGLSLHDENGTYPRVSLISPSFSAIDLRQALGRVHRATGKSPSVQKIVFASDTVEMRVCKSVRAKLNNLDLINDDEMNPII
jgi:superfamily II DNA or RNA helicase